MDNCKITNLTAFLPAKNFKLCCKFYEDLGFEKRASIEGAVRYELDNFGFWLKDYYVKEYAENTMLCLYVPDIQSWYNRIEKLDIGKNYNGLAKVFSKPHEEHGSLVMQLGDPSGILWHIFEGT